MRLLGVNAAHPPRVLREFNAKSGTARAGQAPARPDGSERRNQRTINCSASSSSARPSGKIHHAVIVTARPASDP